MPTGAVVTGGGMPFFICVMTQQAAMGLKVLEIGMESPDHKPSSASQYVHWENRS